MSGLGSIVTGCYFDMRECLGRIVVGQTVEGSPVIAEQIGTAGAMAALLADTFRPNLVQTAE